LGVFVEIFVNERFVYEQVGHEFLVLDAEGGAVVRVEGDEAVVLQRIINGQEVEDAFSSSVQRLLELGVVTESTRGVSRRTALGLGATAVASGFAVMAMPSAAYAASACVFTLTGTAAFDDGASPKSSLVCITISANTCGYDRLQVRADGIVRTATNPNPVVISGIDPAVFTFEIGAAPDTVEVRGAFAAGGAVSEWISLTVSS
jgi:hypothetical protein